MEDLETRREKEKDEKKEEEKKKKGKRWRRDSNAVRVVKED